MLRYTVVKKIIFDITCLGKKIVRISLILINSCHVLQALKETLSHLFTHNLKFDASVRCEEWVCVQQKNVQFNQTGSAHKLWRNRK